MVGVEMKREFPSKIKHNIDTRYIVLLGIIIVLSVIFTIINPSFAKISNILNIIRQTSVLAIIAVGMCLVILTGGIDLSVGSNVALTGAVIAIVLNLAGNPFIGILAGFSTAVAIGFLNGYMIGKYKMQPFMVTLATMSLARGLALGLTDASSIRIDAPVVNWLGQASIMSIPATIIPLLVFYIFFHNVMTKSTFGRYTYAVGGNIRAAKASGILTERHVTQIYALCGLMVGVGSLITVGRLSSAQPWAGLGLEFEVITAVVLGGTSLSGGIGGIAGTLLGSILVGVLGNGLALMRLSPYIQYVMKGLMIIVAVTVDIMSQKGSVAVKKHFDAERYVESKFELLPADTRVLEIKNISKSFPGVKALDDVTFSIKSGTVHALVGENGAGKSTLVKILAGIYENDSGRILINGNNVRMRNPRMSQELGISVIHQEFSLIPELSVSQNIFLGKEIVRSMLLDHKVMDKKANEVLERLNLRVDVKTKVNDLSVGEQQMVEIAKALSAKAWAIFMDEPTSALTEEDKGRLFKVIDRLRKDNIAVVYISHRMPEIFEIADLVTVLRDGQHIATKKLNEVDEAGIIRMMVGRELGDIFKREKAKMGNVVLEVKGLTKHGVFENISFKVREGEVLGLSGLMGAGRTELARCIFGLDEYDSGEIIIDGKICNVRHPRDAMAMGMGFVPEDRRKDGFVPLMSVKENISLPMLTSISHRGWIDIKAETEIASKFVSDLDIKTPSLAQKVRNLSGGNQQKVCLAKWLAREPRLLILDEPTRGIDVGAKAEIHKLIEQLAKQGIAILMISSELPEIVGVSDNIIVLHEGKITGRYSAAEATQEKLMASATATKVAL
jgi:ribose transport system ATP-binding protein